MAFTLPTCDHCGVLNHVLIDGYDVGDRLLEGVMFEVRAVRGRPQVMVTADAAAYFATLNTTRWLRAMRTYARTTDLFICPHCQSEIDTIAPPSTSPQVVVPVRTASLLGRPTPPMNTTQKNVMNTLTMLFGL